MSKSKAKNLPKRNFGTKAKVTKKQKQPHKNFGSTNNKQNSSKKKINVQNKVELIKEKLINEKKLEATDIKILESIQHQPQTESIQQPQTASVQQVEGKKQKKDQYFLIKQKISSSNDKDKQDAIEIIEKGLKDIENRKELTKTAKRRLRQLKKIKKSAEGGEEAVPPAPPTKNVSAKSKSIKRRQRRNAAAKQKAENSVKPETDAK